MASTTNSGVIAEIELFSAFLGFYKTYVYLAEMGPIDAKCIPTGVGI